MSKPDDVSAAAWDAADKVGEAIHGRHERGWVAWPLISEAGDDPQAIVARAIDAAKAEAYGEAAAYVEGKGGVIPGAAVFASLVSRNNQPCMSGDPRDRLPTHTRRDFDDATASLASAIRALVTP